MGSALAQLDDTSTVTVQGQTIQVNPDGTFLIANISAADSLPPRMLSDDCVQAEGISTAGGITRYMRSEPFRIPQGETFLLQNIEIRDTPFPTVKSLSAVAGLSVLSPGDTTGLVVTATRSDGTSEDVPTALTCGELLTTYRTSNPAMADINVVEIAPGVREAQVSANAPGAVFITAVNRGATAVARIDVRTQTFNTTVEGFAGLPDGTLITDAEATVAEQLTGLVTFSVRSNTGIGTPFSIDLSDVPIEATHMLFVWATVDGRPFVGTSELPALMRGGFTDAGITVVLSAALEAISREVSVFNFGPTEIGEAVSREVSLFNFGPTQINNEAVSREVSVEITP